MKLIFVFLLTISLTANAWLLWQQTATPEAAAEPVPIASSGAPAALDSARELAAAGARLIAESETAEPAQMRDALRAAGADDATVRALLEGSLRRRYAEQVSAWQVQRLQTGWWRSTTSGGAPSARQFLTEPLRELLGRDPLDVADAELRYDFLPSEKRHLLALIDLDYAELENRSPQARTGAALKPELDEAQLLQRERQKDILAALTPEQRAEYDLRFGGSARQTARRFAVMDVSEAEFRTLKPMVDTFDEAAKTLQPGGDFLPAYNNLQQQTIDGIVASVGFARAVDYLWAIESGPYQDIVRILREVSRPSHDAALFLQLAAETGNSAIAIHRDPALNAEQKRAALQSLQQETKPAFDALVPAELQPKLPTEAVAWFTDLGEGRYRRVQPAVSGSGWAVPSSRSVTDPLQPTDCAVPLARTAGR